MRWFIDPSGVCALCVLVLGALVREGGGAAGKVCSGELGEEDMTDERMRAGGGGVAEVWGRWGHGRGVPEKESFGRGEEEGRRVFVSRGSRAGMRRGEKSRVEM